MVMLFFWIFCLVVEMMSIRFFHWSFSYLMAGFAIFGHYLAFFTWYVAS
jgi:hypothetical protein